MMTMILMANYFLVILYG